MSTKQHDIPVGTTPAEDHPNHETIEGLRAVADFLAAHPELARASAEVTIDTWACDQRAVLTTLADALGSNANERTFGDHVEIYGTFGLGTRIRAAATRAELSGMTAPPPYQPILATDPLPTEVEVA